MLFPEVREHVAARLEPACAKKDRGSTKVRRTALLSGGSQVRGPRQPAAADPLKVTWLACGPALVTPTFQEPRTPDVWLAPWRPYVCEVGREQSPRPSYAAKGRNFGRPFPYCAALAGPPPSLRCHRQCHNQ